MILKEETNTVCTLQQTLTSQINERAREINKNFAKKMDRRTGHRWKELG
jgi:hypothetical protein